MNQSGLRRRGVNLKALAATLSVGVVVAMGALTAAIQDEKETPDQNIWKADTGITFIPVTRTQVSSAPQYVVDPCDWAAWHVQVHHDFC